jgi:hypothetical protein
MPAIEIAPMPQSLTRRKYKRSAKSPDFAPMTGVIGLQKTGDNL